MPTKPLKDVRLPQPVARIAGTQRQNGDDDGEFRAHFAPSVQAHVIANSTAIGPSALNASQIDWRSQRDS